MSNLINVAAAAAKHYLRQLARHFVWSLRLSRAEVGKDVLFHLPVRISGEGRLRFGSGCQIGENNAFACGDGSRIDFQSRCVTMNGVRLTVLPGCSARFRDGVIIRQNCFLSVAEDWEIGVGSIIQSNCTISAREIGFGGSFAVGERSVVGENSLIDTTGGVTVGDDVAIGPFCIIYTHDHEPETNGAAVWKGPIKLRRVKIGNGAWVGARVIILPGVSIGERAIIGAGAVVTRDVPADSVAVGMPAKVLKRLVD